MNMNITSRSLIVVHRKAYAVPECQIFYKLCCSSFLLHVLSVFICQTLFIQCLHSTPFTYFFLNFSIFSPVLKSPFLSIIWLFGGQTTKDIFYTVYPAFQAAVIYINMHKTTQN